MTERNGNGKISQFVSWSVLVAIFLGVGGLYYQQVSITKDFQGLVDDVRREGAQQRSKLEDEHKKTRELLNLTREDLIRMQEQLRLMRERSN